MSVEIRRRFITWDDLIRRQDLIGGDVEIWVGKEKIYRGPVKSLSVDGDNFIVDRDWTAERDRGVGTWKVCATNRSTFPMQEIKFFPGLTENGKIVFSVAGVCLCVINTVNHGRLSPSEVSGLSIQD
jgi:hypothetical protein